MIEAPLMIYLERIILFSFIIEVYLVYIALFLQCKTKRLPAPTPEALAFIPSFN